MALTAKIESQELEYFKITYEELEKRHKFDSDEKWSELLTSNVTALKGNWRSELDRFYSRIVEDMHLTRGYIFKDTQDTSVNYPKIYLD